MTDEELARKILLDLYPRGTWSEGAEATGIAQKTFQRIVGHGGTIKSENWDLLHDHAPFERAWLKAKEGQEPQFDRKTKEAFGRIALAYGPRNMSALVAMLETLSRRLGANRALNTLEQVESLALQLAESVEESEPGQKSSR